MALTDDLATGAWKPLPVESVIEAALVLGVEPSELLAVLPLRSVDKVAGVKTEPVRERE